MRSFGLIGYPLSHSFSAKYFAQKFAVENIADAEYRLFPLNDISEISSLLRLKPDLQGFNITIPYKVAILPFLQHVSDEAAGVGAVNCVKITRAPGNIKLTGYNTDVYGFRESLLPLLKEHHTQALVLGTGGAAKAVCYTLKHLGIKYIQVSRSKNEPGFMTYMELTENIISNNPLIINTSPLGMYPETEKCPEIPYSFLSERHLLYDLVYNPTETLFMKKGLEAGATVKNGLQMLELQAEKSWEIWNEK